MNALRLDVVTPDRSVVSETVDYVSCPGVEGEFGVLKDHAALLSALKTGALRYDQGGKQQYVFISGGFADVNANAITILADSAEPVQEIDQARAEAARRRAEERLAERSANIDMIRAQAALQRAITRISLASR